MQTPTSTSDAVAVRSGVPQGSVLGPVLFLAFVDPLNYVAPHNVWMHQFSDDTQLGTTVHLRETIDPHPSSLYLSQEEAVRRLTDCISRAEAWFTSNGVKLNIEKSLLFFSSAKKLASHLVPSPIIIQDRTILPSSIIVDLGATFDSHLSMNQHIINIGQKVFCQLRMLSKINRCLQRSASLHKVPSPSTCSIIS